ncbi:MAG: hypothetical protein WBE13_18710 [Candidatus Acidiferrum sp.]
MRVLGCCLILAGIPAVARENVDRIILFPKLYVGQIIRYQIGYRATSNTNTESSVAAPMAPTGGQANAIIFLQVEVEDLRQDAGETLARLRTSIIDPAPVSPNATAPANGASTNNPSASAAQDAKDAAKSVQPGKVIELTLSGDGKVTDVQGLDKLTPDERAAWQEWVARFGGGAALPQKGVRPGEKWKSNEAIPDTLLAGLSWDKQSEYVNDAPCAAMQLTPQGDPSAGHQPQDTCAVILTSATLKQKSSALDATPEDYKLHNLRNTGTAQGQNQIISYFSLTTGLLVRATEDANQSMNVIVATADGSNRVQYGIQAESHSRVLLLADAPANRP